MMKHPSTVWHYTVASKLVDIKRAGALAPTAIGTAPGERPALWFSADPVWEATATKLLMIPGKGVVRPTKEELHALVGLCRFALPNPKDTLQPFAALVRKLRIPEAEARRLMNEGFAVGAKPIDWWGCTEAIPLAQVQLEVWTGMTWAPPDELPPAPAPVRAHFPRLRT